MYSKTPYSKNLYAYTLQGLSPENNVLTVKNNITAGPFLQLDLAFVMRSGRVEKMFSPEEIEVLTQATGLEVTAPKNNKDTLVDVAHRTISKLRLVA